MPNQVTLTDTQTCILISLLGDERERTLTREEGMFQVIAAILQRIHIATDYRYGTRPNQGEE